MSILMLELYHIDYCGFTVDFQSDKYEFFVFDTPFQDCCGHSVFLAFLHDFRISLRISG